MSSSQQNETLTSLLQKRFFEAGLVENCKLNGNYKLIESTLKEDDKLNTVQDFHLALYLGIDGLKMFRDETKSLTNYWQDEGVQRRPLSTFQYLSRSILKEGAKKTLADLKNYALDEEQTMAMKELGYSEGQHYNKVKKEEKIKQQTRKEKSSEENDMKKILNALVAMNTKIDSVKSSMEEKFAGIEERLGKVEERLTIMETIIIEQGKGSVGMLYELILKERLGGLGYDVKCKYILRKSAFEKEFAIVANSNSWKEDVGKMVQLKEISIAHQNVLSIDSPTIEFNYICSKMDEIAIFEATTNMLKGQSLNAKLLQLERQIRFYRACKVDVHLVGFISPGDLPETRQQMIQMFMKYPDTFVSLKKFHDQDRLVFIQQRSRPEID